MFSKLRKNVRPNKSSKQQEEKPGSSKHSRCPHSSNTRRRRRQHDDDDASVSVSSVVTAASTALSSSYSQGTSSSSSSSARTTSPRYYYSNSLPPPANNSNMPPSLVQVSGAITTSQPRIPVSLPNKLDEDLLQAVSQSWSLVQKAPGDWKAQLGKQILFTIAGIEPNTCEILQLESVLRPPARVYAISRDFAKLLEDLVPVLDEAGCDLPNASAVVLEGGSGSGRRRSTLFDNMLALIFPAFCQAAPTAIRRMLHGDWNDEMKQGWELYLKWLCAAVQQGAESTTSSTNEFMVVDHAEC